MCLKLICAVSARPNLHNDASWLARELTCMCDALWMFCFVVALSVPELFYAVSTVSMHSVGFDKLGQVWTPVAFKHATSYLHDLYHKAMYTGAEDASDHDVSSHALTSI